MDISLNYYEVLADSYVNTILESGLLLDEDLQILFNYYKPNNPLTFPKYKPSSALKLSLTFLLGNLLLIKKLHKAFLLPPIIATGISTYFEIKKYKRRGFQQLLLQDMVDNFKNINNLNNFIKKYIKTRIDVENKSQNNLFSGYTKQIDIFLKNTLSNEKLYFDKMIKTIGMIVNFSENLVDDFNLFKYFQPLNDLNRFDNLQDGLDFLNKIKDIHVWLTSKLFSYLSIMFLCPTDQLTDKVYERIIDKLNSLLNFLKQHYNITKKEFYTLRNIDAKINELKSIKPKRYISNNLHKTLLSAIDNISVISEKYHTIITEIETTDDPPSETLQTALIDLRNHTFAAYESLDLLCRLYGILITQSTSENNEIPKVEQHSRDFINVNYHHDDVTYVPEENFELYLEKDYDNAADEPSSYQKDNTEAYLSLMLQELKQSLGKHERFIEARKRRGSIDVNVVAEKIETVIPSFNLSALKSVKTIDVDESDQINDVTLKTNSSVSPPPPLPPPPPPPPPRLPITSFNVQDLSMETPQPKSMFDGIKTLSSQLKMKEEIYEESIDGNGKKD
ncbi:uncharacterized protein LOC130895712 [Diorhabda carinulata]|uniref:uncharacterized protein LOC130895712 n=1 Tax=Diorhabda carinulata TaxID=1163345 RepID=UPI0025A01BA4|nr:uncharacterized protein LOC130895712 [Diorhabda carinulata]XP_057659175.1 uncharacterized protein LOC130895712 [Diorhabda carinulata]